LLSGVGEDPEAFFKVDIAIEVQPVLKNKERAQVNFSKMFSECILKLCRELNIVRVVYDQWQSAHQIDELKTNKINSECYSLTFQDMCFIRTKLQEGKLHLLKPEVPLDILEPEYENANDSFEDLLGKNPIFHLALQILTVREGRNTVKKPTNGTDDLFRALWLAAFFAFNNQDILRSSRYGVSGAFKQNTRGVVTHRVLTNSGSSSSGSSAIINGNSQQSVIVKTKILR